MKPHKTTVSQICDLEAYLGKNLGISPWFKLTQDRINLFADATEDHQWIHIDEEKSKNESPYGAPIAHGFLVLSLMPYLAKMTYEIDHISMGINYGTNKVRFINAVKADSEIRAHVDLLEFEEIDGGAKIILRNTIEIKGDKKPACVAELIAIIRD